MQYRQFGKGGPEISRLGFGAMRLPARKQGEWGSVNFTRATEVLRAAFEAGVNFVDSHHGYHGGLSEVAVGKALKGWKGRRIYIQTKTPWYREEPEDYFKKLLEQALEKLGVDSIDYLLHHAMSMSVWKKRGKRFLKFSDWAMKQGLVRHRGFSTHETPENIQAFIDTGEFACMLVSYNWMNPAVRETIARAEHKGMGVTVMNPVGGGALATTTRQIKGLVSGAGSAAEVALRYVLATPGVTCALSGMNTLEQVAENAAIASRRRFLTESQYNAMQYRLGRIRQRAARFCTGCGYCMPCPHGVDIPGNFGLLNQARFFGRDEWARQQYVRLKAHKNGNKSAEVCRQCGECLPKCPNHVPIVEQLEEVKEALGRRA
jgi:predicted aldo/keto reductase-like oxidoreductase